MDERGRAAPVDPSLELDDATTREDLARCLRALKRRHARRNADTELTFRELAARSGYAYGAICQYFNGKVLPSTDRLEVLTALLGANGPEQGRFASVRDRAQEAARSSAAADSAPLASPRHLPAGTRHFVGRARELQALTASVGADGTDIPVFAIDGMAGVGKTALAVHVGHRLAPRFPDGQLYLELNTHSEGVPARTAYDALGTVLAALGMPPQAIPKDMDTRIARYRDRLASTRTLIVLDDVADEAQVRPLLPGCTGCLVIVTSRKRLKALDDADVLSLDILPQADATALFRKTAGNERLPRDRELVAEVARRCGHLPLALRIVAAVFRHRHSWRIKDLLENLQGSQASLQPFDDGSRSVAAAFDLSYRYLTRELKILFRRLGLAPGRDLDVFAAVALADTDLAPTEHLLQDLVDLSLLTEPALGRYRLHDLLREHARAKSAQDDAETDRDAALDRLLDYYQHTAQAAAALIATVPPVYTPPVGHPPSHTPGLPDRDTASRWMETELDNLCAAAQYAADRTNPLHAITLPAAMAPYLYDHGPWSLAEALHRTASQIAHGLNNPLAQASALHDLGRVLYLTGELPAAADAHQLALELFEQLDQLAGQAAALTELGRVHRLTSDHTGAATALEQALELYRCIDQPAGEANALNHLGHVRQHAGDYPAAATAHLRALELYRRLGQLAGEAGALTNLGAVRHLTGDYPAAADALKHALKLYRQIDQPFGQAIALNNLGRLREVSGDYAGAADALEQSLQLYRRLGQPFGEAEALSNLGRIRRLTADLPAATATLERALELFRRIDQPIGQATALADLGTVRRLSGDLVGARHALQEALRIFRDTNSRGGEAWVLNLYAATFADAGEVSRALRIYRDALSVTREITQPDDEALALEGIGECLLLTGQDQEGVEHLRQALAAFHRLGMQPDAGRVERRLSELALRANEQGCP